ncbi:MAG TPA: hypothetical protein ENG84_01340 [Gammaproteobacteria bacterium]|nr:hypothetical protein [Gammaproteobacteria bacterium]
MRIERRRLGIRGIDDHRVERHHPVGLGDPLQGVDERHDDQVQAGRPLPPDALFALDGSDRNPGDRNSFIYIKNF